MSLEGKYVGRGKVFLVGAGPGDPELLTLKALKVLRKADVIFYDHLVPRAVLKLAPERVKKIYVGKQPRRPTISQSRIHEILIAAAREGKTVVRLKGGDPLLFGRGGEEAQELQRSGIQFEVVPGITSALAAPAYAGIPLTHRDYASSVAIVTGHEATEKSRGRVEWERLATAADTIVVLMGVERLGEIAKRLMGGGRDPETPVAIIEWGATRRQRVTVGALCDIEETASQRAVAPPAVIVVGGVVELQKELSKSKGGGD